MAQLGEMSVFMLCYVKRKTEELEWMSNKENTRVMLPLFMTVAVDDVEAAVCGKPFHEMHKGSKAFTKEDDEEVVVKVMRVILSAGEAKLAQYTISKAGEMGLEAIAYKQMEARAIQLINNQDRLLHSYYFHMVNMAFTAVARVDNPDACVKADIPQSGVVMDLMKKITLCLRHVFKDEVCPCHILEEEEDSTGEGDESVPLEKSVKSE